ncbi:tRNA 5-methoxyuridine(34)/uridine 5-oxyacetic acid(34) synthase CmoB [Desulfotalea psychrophila]|uniref:tRNA U34 carboxymethyltransferase n=1 Tax=Desulfotalea psychrophila (strain LSv54 / DSM 12343) TaxID=177439 RepID=CMOB_DESPS|nr:tRNA 5-methoxyuridine(34)/uridine 5-oxyacetic acid(34) synthase CmoB [Desulfotalea psychrophila]Q6AIL0.1 RecName: Full=tRNA U34 carboxymethyltransferase [Desulfotalea psychrophila LSv54]CAG37820.1 conserved hypothetical protein [Desulfotalea psychrophila LSv54]
MKYLKHLSDAADREAIKALHDERQTWVNQEKKGFLRYREPYLQLARFKADSINLENDVVTIGHGEQISHEEQAEIRQALRAYMPWRKGPFAVFGVDIDAEWRSERKWQRLEKHLPDLKGKVIADIGCNNGYYMFRMAAQEPAFVLGIEPSVQHYYCFKALEEMSGLTNLEIDLLGVEHLPLFTESFDVVFLMGIIYHRSAPIETLRAVLDSLKPGGTLILETQGIPGEQPYALFPDKTYAKVPGTYFVPSASCLINWMHKAGFIDVDLFCDHPMSPEEQRQTEWMEFESYKDFLDPENPELTLEGYPAPHRFFVKATKKM